MDEKLFIDAQRSLSVRQPGLELSPRLRDAWEQFYRRYDPFVRAAVAACHVSPANRDDSVQDAWLELARALPNLRLDPSRGTLLAWMRTVVFRSTRDKRRRQTLSQTPCDSQAVIKALCDPNTRTPAAECERRETRAAVRSALRAFRRETSRVNFRVLYLISIKGLSADDVARRLNLTVPQVWARHHRIKRRFRRLFRESEIA